MKLRWYDRILVALSGLVLAALCVMIVLCGCGAVHLPEPFALDVWTGGDWQWLPAIFLGGLLVFLWGMRLLIRPFCFGKDKQSNYFVVKTSEQDTMSISVAALDQLIRKCLAARPEVLTSKVTISGQEKAMRVHVRVTLRGGVCIPEVVTKLQEQIKQYVTGCSGVPVETVRVTVEASKDAGGDEGEVKLLNAVEKLPPVDAGRDEEIPAQAPEKTVQPEAPAVPEAPAAQEAAAEPEKAEPEAPAEETVPAESEAPAETAEAPAGTEQMEAEAPVFDFGPEEKLPVDLSPDAFPFPDEKK